VSAVPDARHGDGVYFALDRIARAVGDGAANLELPLPAVTVVGNGAPLPAIDSGVSATITDLQITVLAGSISIGTMPRAHLAATGVVVDLGSDGYPGKTVTVDQLPAALRALAGKSVSILAPAGMQAESLVPVVTAASAVMPVYLAARSPSSPESWDIPAAIATPLTPDRVTAGLTVQKLAEALARVP